MINVYEHLMSSQHSVIVLILSFHGICWRGELLLLPHCCMSLHTNYTCSYWWTAWSHCATSFTLNSISTEPASLWWTTILQILILLETTNSETRYSSYSIYLDSRKTDIIYNQHRLRSQSSFLFQNYGKGTRKIVFAHHYDFEIFSMSK